MVVTVYIVKVLKSSSVSEIEFLISDLLPECLRPGVGATEAGIWELSPGLPSG